MCSAIFKVLKYHALLPPTSPEGHGSPACHVPCLCQACGYNLEHFNFFLYLFWGRQIEPEMCTICRTGAMSDSTVSLCFSGVAKNAILIQSCNPACKDSFLKLRRVTM